MFVKEMKLKKLDGIMTNKSESKLDKLTGKYTVSAIVAILFVITLTAFVIMYCNNNNLPNGVINFFTTLLLALVGFFGFCNVRKAD